MPAQITNYQCPACTGPLHFVGASGKLECDYCGSQYDVAEMEALYAEKEKAAAEAQSKADAKAASEKAELNTGSWDTSGMTDDWGADASGMCSYICPSCGAELICESTTAATSCPYCGNPTVVPGQFSGTLRPDHIIPFKLSREDAIAALKKHYKGKPLLPKQFTDPKHIDEVKGVYVPFWMFDGRAKGSANFECTRTTSYESGDYEITETEHFDVFRSGSIDFEKVPVDASKKMPDDYMDSLEPYNYSELKSFSSAYLPGFLADKYDVSVEESAARADERCASTFESALRGTVNGYDGCVTVGRNIELERGKVHYALLPVWLLTTKWDGKDYLFAMNGQTGKLVGKLPTSWKRALGIFAAITAGFGVLASAIMLFL